MKKYEGLVQDEEGDKVSNATITVKDYVGGANSTIYASDVAGSSGSNINGFTNESDGTFSFYATDGYYNIEISKPGLTTKTISNVHIKDTESIVFAQGYLTLQAAINANPGDSIYLGEFAYGVSTALVIEDDNTRIYGAGPGRSYIINTSLTGHAVKFYPNDTTTTSTFLNNCALDNLTIYSSANKSAGAGLYLLQCSGFRLHNVQIQNHPEGLVVAGGQLNNFDMLTVYASASILTSGAVADSQGIYLREAPIDGGLYQGNFTCEFTNTVMALSRVIDRGLRVGSADGAHFTNGYWGGAYSSEIHIECVTAGEYVAGLEFNSIYLDGLTIGEAGTRNAITIPSSALGTIYSVKYRGGLIGNYNGKGCVVGEGVGRLEFNGVEFVNTASWGIDVVGSNTFTDLIINACQFDSVGDVTDNTGAVSISTVVSAIVTNNSFTNINDTGATAVLLSGTNVNGQFANNSYYNCTNTITNSATWTGRVVGIPITVVPAITFATPGDLNVAYSGTPYGRYTIVGNRCHAEGNITATTFTHTTASGDLQITGFPTAITSSGQRALGALAFNGITKANYTNFNIQMPSGGTALTIFASGSAQGIDTVDAADVPTAGTKIFTFSIDYEVAP